MKKSTLLETALALLLDELVKAHNAHSGRGIVSQHEGWAIMHEEMVELFDAIRAKHPDGEIAHDTDVAEEAIQVGAMALRFLVDLNLVDSLGLESQSRVQVEL